MTSKPRYSYMEEKFIRQHHDRNHKWIAQQLGRSPAAVHRKRNRMGIGKDGEKPVSRHVFISDELDEKIRKEASKQGYSLSGFIRMVLEKEVNG